MRARKLRGRVAAELKKRVDRTTDPTARRNLYKWIERVYPLERRAPEGYVFVPERHLGPDAQGRIASLRVNKRWPIWAGGAAYSLLPSITASRALDLLPAYERWASTHPTLDATAFFATLATPVAIMLTIAALRHRGLYRNIDFMRGYLRKSTDERIRRLRDLGYTRFDLPSDHGIRSSGIVLAKGRPGVNYRGIIGGRPITVIEREGDRVYYRGFDRRLGERRSGEDRRKRDRRSDKGKRTIRTWRTKVVSEADPSRILFNRLFDRRLTERRKKERRKRDRRSDKDKLTIDGIAE